MMFFTSTWTADLPVPVVRNFQTVKRREILVGFLSYRSFCSDLDIFSSNSLLDVRLLLSCLMGITLVPYANISSQFVTWVFNKGI